MPCKPIRCLILLKSSNLMHLSAEQEETKKKQEPKKEYFLLEMSLVSGTPNFNDQSYGIYTMVKFIKEKMFVHSLLVTGQSWIMKASWWLCQNIFNWNKRM